MESGPQDLMGVSQTNITETTIEISDKLTIFTGKGLLCSEEFNIS